MSDLATIQEGWDRAAREDAMFNIITHGARVNGGWTTEEFFQHGQAEINLAMGHLEGLVDVRWGRALDFGCGIGRLTQALGTYFQRVDGVDVSSEMVEQARSHNRHPGRVEYHLNSQRIPFRASTFDFAYSMIVLQHMPQTLQKGYVAEFFRVLKSGGVAMFEMPDGPDYVHPNEWLSMYGVPRATVEEWVAEDGGTLIDVELIPEPSQWECLRYTAVAS